jgi:hypothetical protein
MQIVLKRRAQRFTFDANYTWSHELDDMPNVLLGFADQNNLKLDYGSGDIDVRHCLNADVVYDIPSPHTGSRIANGILGGWRASTILQVRSGLPYDIGLLGSFFGENFNPVRPDLVPGQPIYPANYHAPDSQLNPAAFAAFPMSATRFGTAGRNLGRGPAFSQWDFSIMKDTRLSERFKLEFRAEFYNIPNHPNFSSPNGTLCNAVSAAGVCTPNALFGVSTSTIGTTVSFGNGTERQGQFALRLLF